MQSKRGSLRLLLFLFTLSSASAQTQDAIPPQRIVYLLAGQSNIEWLKLVNPTTCGTGSQQFNVTYFDAVLTPATGLFSLSAGFPIAPAPLLQLGTLLGQHHAPHHVDVVMIARSGSALFFRNQIWDSWLDPQTPGNPQVLYERLKPLLQQLAQHPIDELHIVWGQGETDCISVLQPAQTFEYYQWAQVLFFALAVETGYTGLIHADLVTIGAIEQSPNPSTPIWYQNPVHVNQIRDAYYYMGHLPSAPSIVLPRPVAHHYDLTHRPGDPYHLTDCDYVTLAQRIADGIISPTAQPKVSPHVLAQPSPNNDIIIPVSVQLAPFSVLDSTFFEVTVNTSVVSGVTVTTATAPNRLIVHVAGPALQPNDAITVRYVDGSGFGGAWATTTPIRAATPGPLASRPLEPFVLSR